MTEPMSPVPATRFRLVTLLVLVAVFAAGQVIAVGLQTTKLWPFSPISVYTHFPSDLDGRATNVVAVVAGVDVDAVRIGDVNYRIFRKFLQGMEKAKSDEEALAALQGLLAYVRLQNTGALPIDGVRAYELNWDLAAGKIVHSEFLHEYVGP